MRILIALPLLLAACGGASFLREPGDCPPGYVPLETSGDDFLGRAISSSGVVLAVRQRENRPQGTPEFWSEVVRKDLTEGRGYAVRSTKELRKGRLTVFSVPQDKATSYALFLRVDPEQIVSVEMAGPQGDVDRDLPALEQYVERRF
jgi:hypothetical protein